MDTNETTMKKVGVAVGGGGVRGLAHVLALQTIDELRTDLQAVLEKP